MSFMENSMEGGEFLKWEGIGEMNVKKRDAKYLSTVAKMQKRIRAMVAEYIAFVDVDEYKGDDDQMVEDMWFELFNSPVSEVCEEAVEQWKEMQEDA